MKSLKMYAIVALIVILTMFINRTVLNWYVNLFSNLEQMLVSTSILSIISMNIISQTYVMFMLKRDFFKKYKNTIVRKLPQNIGGCAFAVATPLWGKEVYIKEDIKIKNKQGRLVRKPSIERALIEHELGHLKHNHWIFHSIMKHIISVLPICFMMYIVNDVFLQYVLLIVVGLSTAIINAIIQRELEYDADRCSHKSGAKMIRALEYLNELGYESPNNFINKLMSSHPSHEDRIKKLKGL